MSTPALRKPAGTARYAGGVLLLALVYFVAARLGLRFASIGESISLVWPPTGIAFATLVLAGRRYWPGVTAGAFLANALTNIPLEVAAGIAAGNTLEALVAATLLRRVTTTRPDLEDLATVRTLVVLAAPLGTIVSAAVGVFSLWSMGGLSTGFVLPGLATWWAGDMVGALVVAPLILAWTVKPREWVSRGMFEILALCLGAAAIAELTLGRIVPVSFLAGIEYPYLLFPFVIWAALRFGARGATLLTFILTAIAVLHTVAGRGPFLEATPATTLLAIAAYLGVLAVTGLGLAAAVSHERDRAREALYRSREQLRRSLDAARMGTWVWSVESNTLEWDDNLRRLYGLAPSAPVTGYEDFISRVHPDDRAFVEQAIRASFERDQGLDYEFRIVLPDGSVRWIADQGHLEKDEAGRPLQMTGVCMDITDRRVSEERIRQVHRMESVGRLAGGVAHETNNQMSVVLGASSFVLARPDLPEAVRTDVQLIQRAAERTAAITAQLLAFSRRQVMSRQVVDLNHLLSEMQPLVQRAMGEDCVVALSLASDLPGIRSDAGQLQQALLNLAINARDAMPEGGRLTIETMVTHLTAAHARARPGVHVVPGEYVTLVVTDTGTGIEPDTMEHIFEPFFTTKPVGQGTGLGLATVYGIVKQSDGYVWAYSEPGQGSTFRLYFPATREPSEAVAVPEGVVPEGHGERILVVEDEPGVRGVVARALREAGYRVEEAENGDAALALAGEEQNLDLLLTDMVMPGMNGRELARRIREDRPDLPVIYMSGYTDSEIARRGLLETGATFIQKPFNPDVVVEAVARDLQASGNTGPAR